MERPRAHDAARNRADRAGARDDPVAQRAGAILPGFLRVGVRSAVDLTPERGDAYAPIEPYGGAKAFGDFLIRSYRAKYDLFACSGILFNHESPRRPEQFVTRKITIAAAKASLGLQDTLTLGDLEAERDWGFAGDVVRAARAMLAADEPGDYVLATGATHSVRELAALAFDRVGLDWADHVVVDEGLRRGPGAVANLVGDASLARERLGWQPSVSFEELVAMMVDADLERLAAQAP